MDGQSIEFDSRALGPHITTHLRISFNPADCLVLLNNAAIYTLVIFQDELGGIFDNFRETCQLMSSLNLSYGSFINFYEGFVLVQQDFFVKDLVISVITGIKSVNEEYWV